MTNLLSSLQEDSEIRASPGELLNLRLHAVDGSNNYKDAVYSYAAPLTSATGVLSSIVIELNREKDDAEIGFASLSRMGMTEQKVSFVIYNAHWLQDNSKIFLKNGSNIFHFTLNLIDSSNGQVVSLCSI